MFYSSMLCDAYMRQSTKLSDVQVMIYVFKQALSDKDE